MCYQIPLSIDEYRSTSALLTNVVLLVFNKVVLIAVTRHSHHINHIIFYVLDIRQ